ncbi:hypothetical protein LMTR13_38030 [Bradyrhizobium icense]|uniref:Uncharacterized protein n=1 Tax=Bradyrhizobium icense TaxID=1274631 RepID=A0A1B1UQK2_9BRAD|nr:hypothetical protein LMTR13_38030 [Bradyrhizobium icense]
MASRAARRDALVAWPCRAMERSSATRLEPAWQSAPAVALHRTAGVAARETASPSERKAVEASAWVPPAVSAQRELPPAAEAAVGSDAQAPPQEVAVSESDVRVRPQEAAAEAVLDAAERLPGEAAAGSGVVAELPPAAGAAVPGVAVGQPPEAVTEASGAAAAPRREAVE